MLPLADRAARWGIETDYADALGQRRSVPAEALEAVLGVVEALDLPPPDPVLPLAVVLRRGRAVRLDLDRLPPHALVQWHILDAGAVVACGAAPARDCRLPADLPLGTYTLRLTGRTLSGPTTHRAPLLVAPPSTCQGDTPDRRLWALAVQLYGVRSQRNWGHGDFSDLAALLELAAALGAAGVGLNPLHALFDDRLQPPSPYAPNSRLFLNPLYIDVEAVPDFPGLDAAGLVETVARLREAPLIDYTGVAAAKTAALRLSYARFRADATTDRREDFEAFRTERGTALSRFAAFEVLRRRFPQAWWEWPPDWRRPTADALDRLKASAADAIGYHEYLQWIADRQLGACRARAAQLGLPLGLYLDVAVGVDAGGADAWSDQTAILHGLSVGAPPDQFNPDGQNWGIAGFHARGLSAESFEPFRQMLAAAMRHAGAIRIDHVLGLNRLFLIPHGAPARHGAYFRLPLDAMLAVVAQESVARRCIVIGEDLGTVPPDLRDVLSDWGLWSYRVVMFERDAQGRFLPPHAYPRQALATFNTHDLPTFAGWMAGHDLALRRRLGLGAGETVAEREATRRALAAALAAAGLDPAEGFLAVVKFLAMTPCRLAVVAIEDVLGLLDQPNLPGTVDEHPNWRQRLPSALETWRHDARLQAIAAAFAAAGRSARP